MIEQFHFLRPGWLLALIPLAAVIWLLLRGRYQSGNWLTVVDPRLQPHVLSGAGRQAHGSIRWVLAAVAALAIVALAGPTWEKRQQAVFDRQAALVVTLDLSRSMDAADIKPTRLTRARHKIADILNLRKEGQTALVVYAADAFAVTPLTHDTDTILALLPDLKSELMPAQGTRADRALERALELFDNGGVRRGDVLLVSDGFSDLEVSGLEALLDERPGQRISVLAIGTPEGGPVPLGNGGFLKDRNGDIVIADMNVDNLRRAVRNGGVYAAISADDGDIDKLTRAMETSLEQREALHSDYSADLWRELGPGLVLLLLPFAALAFRRGLIWLIPLCIVVLPPDAQAFDWQSLWRNDDQRALRLFEQQRHAEAAQLFDDQEWQAAARYRAGEYEAAARDWERLDGEASRYNHATALAQQGRYEDALAAYERVLERNPAHEDALFNRQAIEDLLRQQQQQQQQQQSQSQQGEGEQEQQSQQGDGQQGRDDKQSGEQSEQQQGSQGQQQETPRQQQGGESQASTGDAQQEVEPYGQQQPADEARRDQQSSRQTRDPAPNETDGQRSDEEVAADQQMSEQAAQQWLRKIPDDPGGLLRRKFIYQYRSRGGVDVEEQSW